MATEVVLEELASIASDFPCSLVKKPIRIDSDILNWFRRAVDDAGSGNYQTLINNALREYIEGKSPKLEETLRRVVREELARFRHTRTRNGSPCPTATQKKIPPIP